MTTEAELPRYTCHKTVHALQIRNIIPDSDGHAHLTFEERDYAPIKVNADWLNRHKPKSGGYYVVYEDGYTSFSPAKAFENGYTRDE